MSMLEWQTRPETMRLRARLADAKQEVFATVVSFEEQSRGWLAKLAKARRIVDVVQAYDRLLSHLENYKAIQVLPFDERAATEYQQLQKLKLRVGTMDLRIAAIVRARGARLLTRNRSDFAQVPDLHFDDWIS
jgi:tRNA(fMet)-specific endonuclease VapC